MWLCGGEKRPPPLLLSPPTSRPQVTRASQGGPQPQTMRPNYDGHVSRSGREAARRNREYALCIYATEYFPHVSESYRERFSCFQSILFVLKLPYVCLLPPHISLSLIYHLAMYFCTWQGMVYVRFGHYSITLSSRALDVECDVSKLCWIFCIFVPVITYTIIFFRFTSFMKTKISIYQFYPRIQSKSSS